ncbi:MAG: chitinase [Thermoleophilales bacterium]|jgi:chitinase|nr:chitinase [Thermoleophilales bacterium]
MSSTNEMDPALLPDPPEPKLSPLRVLVALLVLVVAGAGGFFGLRHVETTQAARAIAATRDAPWFAPYVDATLTPTVAFQDRSANPSRDVVLGFVVAGKGARAACTPTWGTYETLAGAATSMDLDRRVAQVRGQGGDAVISFGGKNNSELAVACARPDALASAYRSVIDRYTPDTIDFDVEGAALSDTAANVRRAQAIKTIQDDVRAHKGRLAVWLTLPVTPRGLNPDALAVVRTMLDAKVDLAGVNVMSMDFGEPAAGRNMLRAVTSSISATHGQIAVMYRRAGLPLSPGHLWGKLGVTVMIGQNDVDGERVSVRDARAIATFARSHGLGRVSTWSLNRDAQCGSTFPVLGTHSNFCSGVAQDKLQFSKTFARLRGSARSQSAAVTTPDSALQATSTTVDDPAKSPYPIWQPEQAYREGYKVVWHQAVYVAKWYSQGQTPDSENVAPGALPWQLIGPVLSTDRAPKIPTLPAGTYPEWKVSRIFRAGERVLYQGLPYQASWYTVGDVPGGTGENGTPSPWKALYKIPGEPTTG